MINFSTLILSSEVSGPGGLFDFNATLPIVIILFVFLMITLTSILYNPLLTIIDERNDYILTYLGDAAKLLAEANALTAQYEEELATIRKEAQLEITNSQEIHKEILDLEIDMSQKYLDSLLNTVTRDFEDKKIAALNNLEDSVQSLCEDINKRLAL